MRAAFAAYAESHEPASIRRCWSTWNTLCTFLFANEEIPMNPMPLIGRPKLAKTLPKALPTDSVAALLATLNEDPPRPRRSDWVERDRALILTALLAGLRADELLRANVGDLRPSDDGAVSTSAARAARTVGSRSKRRWSRSSSAIWIAARPVSVPPPGGAPPAGDWRPGRRRRRYSSVRMVSGSPAVPCNTGCCALFAVPASTPTSHVAPSCTGCATPLPPNSPTPRSASTP